MKKWIKPLSQNEEDWQLNSSSDDVNALKEVMSANMDRQDDAEVGIFWFDPQVQSLFGVKSASVDDMIGHGWSDKFA